MKNPEDKILTGYDAFFASYLSIDVLIDSRAGDNPYILAPIIAATSGMCKAYGQLIKSPIADACLLAAVGYAASGADALIRSPSEAHTAQATGYLFISAIYFWQYLRAQKEQEAVVN